MSRPSPTASVTGNPDIPTTKQPLCFQDFACNPFRFIDLAGTPSPRPNHFKNLRGNAIFFQE
jgi:hypothetical protein